MNAAARNILPEAQAKAEAAKAAVANGDAAKEAVGQ